MMVTRRTFQAGLLAAAASGHAAHAEPSLAPGTFSGVLDAGLQHLRLRIDLAADGTASIVSLDQSRTSYPGHYTFSGADRIEIDFSSLGGAFSGRVVGPDRIEGRWRQGGGDFPLVIMRGGAALAPLPPPSALTRERLAALRIAAGSPAMAAAVARRGSQARVWVDGERAVGSGIAVQETDVWHLGSITKSMTATLVGRLVDRGDLRWDETVGDVLGAIAPDMRDVYRPATFRHLLSHRSGLPANLSLVRNLLYARELADAREERKSYVREALALEPAGPMTTTYLYSNLGYVVAGAMLEAKLGKSWEDLVTQHLFEPLELASAGFGAPGHAGANDQPAGHTAGMFGEKRQGYPAGGATTDIPVVIGPAGRVHMSLQDLLRYLAAHRDSTDFLQAETWMTLHTPPFGGNYALGWVVRGDGALWHNGSNTLWYAEVLVDAAHGIVAAAAANDGYRLKSQPAVGEALREAAAAA